MAVFYYDSGILGLWLGPLTAMIVVGISYYAYVLIIDWKKVVAEAEARRHSEKKNK
jgi:hypothetical protein